jgi:two-component system, NarL family, sensor histidine kinase DesK
VTNIIRHSRADRCDIRVTQEDEEVRVEVKDDGHGSPPEHEGTYSNSSGLSGLAERVSASGGDFEAGPLPEGGFRMRVSLPAGSVREDKRR